jgi:hypothetical protein
MAMWKRLLLVVAVAALVAAGGCTHVVTETAPYYARGPWQIEPADGVLPAGTEVRLIAIEAGWARVWSWRALDVYVWRDLLRPIDQAEANPPAEPRATPAAAPNANPDPAP